MGGRFWALCLMSGIVLVGAGCGGSSSGTTQLRIVQASLSVGNVNVLIDGTNVASTGYGAATSYQTVSTGSRHVQVQSTSSSTNVVDENVSFSSGDSKTLIVENVSPNITGAVLSNQTSTPDSGNFAIRVHNASSIMGPVDIYIVPTGTDINTVNPSVTSLAFGSTTSYTSLTAGVYQVLLTQPGTKSPLVNTGPVSLTSGQVRTIVAIANAGGASSTYLNLPDLN